MIWPNTRGSKTQRQRKIAVRRHGSSVHAAMRA